MDDNLINGNSLAYYLRNPIALKELDKATLSGEIERYPYSAHLHLLLVIKDYLDSGMVNTELLERAALYISDRKKLGSWVNRLQSVRKHRDSYGEDQMNSLAQQLQITEGEVDAPVETLNVDPDSQPTSLPDIDYSHESFPESAPAEQVGAEAEEDLHQVFEDAQGTEALITTENIPSEQETTPLEEAPESTPEIDEKEQIPESMADDPDLSDPTPEAHPVSETVDQTEMEEVFGAEADATRGEEEEELDIPTEDLELEDALALETNEDTKSLVSEELLIEDTDSNGIGESSLEEGPAEDLLVLDKTDQIEEDGFVEPPSQEVHENADPLAIEDPFVRWLHKIDSEAVTRYDDLEQSAEVQIEKPTKKKKKKRKKKKKKAKKKAWKESLQSDEAIVSEALAELLAAQGHKDKAKEMYEKLRLIIPEKSIFFAQKIEELDKKS